MDCQKVMAPISVVSVRLVRDHDPVSVSGAQIRFAGKTINCSADAYDMLGAWMASQSHEMLVVVAMNTRREVIAVSVPHIGGISESIVDPCVIAQTLLLCNAKCCIIAHNHPSGNPSPSPSDTVITKQVYLALRILGIELVDHIIVGHQSKYSFADLDLMPYIGELDLVRRVFNS